MTSLRVLTFDAHIQDIFDIISYLKSSSKKSDLSPFVFLVHRRSFRKLGFWVKVFSTRWGDGTPFKVAQSCLDAIKGHLSIWKGSFVIQLDELQYTLVSSFVGEDSILDPGQRKYQYAVNASNVENWLHLFDFIWRKLQATLMETIPSEDTPHGADLRVIAAPPDKSCTQRITFFVASLRSLLPIMKYLFFLPLPELDRALDVSGMFSLTMF